MQILHLLDLVCGEASLPNKMHSPIDATKPHIISCILESAYTSIDNNHDAVIDCIYDSEELIKRLISRLHKEELLFRGTKDETFKGYSEYHVIAAFIYMDRIKKNYGRVSSKNVTILFVIAVYVAGKIIDDWCIGAKEYCRILGCESVADVTHAERSFLKALNHNLFLTKEEVASYLKN